MGDLRSCDRTRHVATVTGQAHQGNEGFGEKGGWGVCDVWWALPSVEDQERDRDGWPLRNGDCAASEVVRSIKTSRDDVMIGRVKDDEERKRVNRE